MAGGLKKGQTNNPNGRPKGSKNRVTELIRIHVNELVLNNIPEFNKRLQTLNNKDYCSIIQNLAVRFLGNTQPSTNNTQINIGDVKGIKWQIVAVDASVKDESIPVESEEPEDSEDFEESEENNDAE